LLVWGGLLAILPLLADNGRLGAQAMVDMPGLSPSKESPAAPAGHDDSAKIARVDRLSLAMGLRPMGTAQLRQDVPNYRRSPPPAGMLPSSLPLAQTGGIA